LLWPSAHLPVVLLLLRQRDVAAGSGLGASLGTTIKYVRRTARGAAGNGMSNTMKYLRCLRNGFSGIGLGTSINCLWQTTAANNRLATTIKYLRGAASIGIGTTIKYPRCTTTQRPEHHNQVSAAHNERRRKQRTGHFGQIPAAHNERRRGQRPKPMPEILMCPFTTSALRSACLLRASFANKKNSTTEGWGLC
jgi:hypothetical protein